MYEHQLGRSRIRRRGKNVFSLFLKSQTRDGTVSARSCKNFDTSHVYYCILDEVKSGRNSTEKVQLVFVRVCKFRLFARWIILFGGRTACFQTLSITKRANNLSSKIYRHVVVYRRQYDRLLAPPWANETGLNLNCWDACARYPGPCLVRLCYVTKTSDKNE